MSAPDTILPAADAATHRRFWAKVQKTATCWLWTGALCKGHGRFHVNGVLIQAHHFLWVQKNGPVPEGMVLDHKECSNKACIRDDHLILNTHGGNTSRYFAEERTRCARGHEMTPANTQVRKGGATLCKTCNRWRSAANRMGMTIDQYASFMS